MPEAGGRSKLIFGILTWKQRNDLQKRADAVIGNFSETGKEGFPGNEV